LAHIWGVPGSGKTALAAELAAEGHRYGQTILWHTCRAGRDTTLPGIIRGLAQALAGTGDDQLWREVRQAPADEQDINNLLATLRDRLLARPAVIVLDDIHRAEADEMGMLMDALADLIAHRSTRLLLVGRAAIAGSAYRPLPGLIEREALLLWAGIPALPAEQWRALYAATGGLPEPLRRVAAVYRRAGDLARPLDWVAEVEAWTQEEIWSRLSQDEQRLCAAAHALAAHLWGDQATLVCESLGMSIATLEGIRDRGLLQIAGAHVTILSALQPHAAVRVGEDDDLRLLVENLATTLKAMSSAAPEQESEGEPPPATIPAGLELLARIRNALEDSAEYLQEQQDDQVARQLAAELEMLQAALPDLSGPQPALDQKAVAAPTS
jgi:adenylate kinase family enzyme